MMDFKSLMIKSLSDLLIGDETLKYPIYGILEQAENTYYGFFGLTDDFLLVALVQGKEITYTTRIPLDIKTVRVKKSLILKENKIDISFNIGSPCRIVAFGKVLTIDSQKENLPLFLEYLTSKSTQKEHVKIKEINGEKIRWQYFNAFIYFLLSYVPTPIIIEIFMGLKEGNFVFHKIISVLPFFAVWLIILFPLVVLSLVNRFLFGKIVCAVNETGIYCDYGFISHHDIQRLTYNPKIIARTRTRLEYSYVIVSVKTQEQEYDINIIHFPIYGLRKVKKYNPQIEIKIGKGGLFLIGFLALMPSILAILLSLFL